MPDSLQLNRRKFVTASGLGLASTASAAATATSSDSVVFELYRMLSDRQQRDALISMPPEKQELQFRGQQSIPGLPVTDMSPDQKEHLQAVLGTLTEMHLLSDQTKALAHLTKQGGLDACSICFFSDDETGHGDVLDSWRLESPAIVWHYHGAPNVQIRFNIADDAPIKTNTHLVG